MMAKQLFGRGVRRLFCAMSIAVVSGAAAAWPANAQAVVINAPELGRHLQSANHPGYYSDLAQSLLARVDIETEFSVVPLKRLIADLNAKTVSCVWSLDIRLLKKFGVDPADLIESDPLLISSQYVFTRAGTPPVLTIEELVGKRVAVLAGSPLLQELLELGAEVVRVETQEAKLSMLNLGRVDATFGWLPDFLISANYLKLPPPVIGGAAPLSPSKVNFVCLKDPKTDTFLPLVNTAIKDFTDDGSFLELNSYWGIETWDPAKPSLDQPTVGDEGM